ncbi:MAG TPA: sigma 54-interacting transcriptional regulator [Polyangiaceae bacterium]|nr:sigma 54-interacting transcriptional regulator [Polyangiaceae bacterium]
MWLYPREIFVRFTPDALTLGRASDCGVVLEGGLVSRVHATVRPLGPLFVLRDEGSRNGTYQNGEAVREAPLVNGDIVRIGEWVGCVIELDEAVAASGAYFRSEEGGLLLGPRSQESWQRAARVAESSAPILIEGPTGTGKEVFARAIHARSRRGGSFVAVNCAALPESLVESHLFGHAKGSFTGATQSTEGLIGAAQRGTLLLDEIIDLPTHQQAKLLRVLEESSVVRVGETTPRPIDVRFVAACQEPLWKRIEKGSFRADLLGRLAGFTLKLSPLRERREEIPRLFLQAFAAAGGDAQRIKSSAIEALCLESWPLNVRQLVHVARYAATGMVPGAPITRSSLSEALGEAPPQLERQSESPPDEPAIIVSEAAAEPRSEEPDSAESRLGRRRMLWLRRQEEQLSQLLNALKQSKGNVSMAARSVGLSRSAATRLLEAKAQREGER